MAIRTQQSFSGFLVTDPELTITSSGDARFYAKVGQEHFHRNDDGSFTQLESTFHNLVQYRKAAERSYERFQKGDHFVAEGYVHEYDHDVDGNPQRAEEFIAKKIGHDAPRHNYTVNRRNVPDVTLEDGVILQTSEVASGAVPAAVSARSAVAARESTRRSALANITPDGGRTPEPTRSDALAL